MWCITTLIWEKMQTSLKWEKVESNGTTHDQTKTRARNTDSTRLKSKAVFQRQIDFAKNIHGRLMRQYHVMYS